MSYTQLMENSDLELKRKLESALLEERLIVLPTETVYGLAAPINSPKLVEKIFKLKERPLFDPLIVHVSSEAEAKKLVLGWPALAQKLAQSFWPGPLTIVLKRNPEVISDLITAGLDTVGIRAPSHPVARKILELVGVPLAAPSANKFTKTSPTSNEHVKKYFSDSDVLYIEGEESTVGLESTIVEVHQDEDSEFDLTILRRGLITSERLKQELGDELRIGFGKSAVEVAHEIKAPGMHYIHYRPDWPVIVCDRALEKLAPGELQDFTDEKFEVRSLGNDPMLAARNLYATLQKPLKEGASALIIDVQGLDFNDEINMALWDRLHKAASLFLIH